MKPEKIQFKAMTPGRKPGTLRYALIGAAIFVITGGILGILSMIEQFQITRTLKTINEQNNILLTRVFANLVWPGIRDFVAEAHNLPADALKTHPKIAETHTRAVEMAKNVPLLKIKIFDLNGLTVYSSDPSQIGQLKTTYPGFVSARNGQVASFPDRRETFNAFGAQLYNRHIQSSYVPISDDTGEIEGVFEIYTDTTAAIVHARNAGILRLAVVGLVFLLIYALGISLIRHRDRTIADIHARQLRLTEMAVAAEESNRAKSALLANMSHELRTPLNAVIGFAETMRLQPFGPIGSPKYLTYLEDIWKSGRQLLGIVDNVLEMARIDDRTAKLQISGAVVSDLITWAVRQIDSTASGPRAPIRIHSSDAGLAVLVDERRMRHVLTLLISNARNFTPPHGSIEISAKRNRTGDLEIIITDTGIGMAPEEVKVALIPFNKMDLPYGHAADGPKLGLPLARMLMELHGGSLTVESVLGKGTSITATLPSRCIITERYPTVRVAHPR